MSTCLSKRSNSVKKSELGKYESITPTVSERSRAASMVFLVSRIAWRCRGATKPATPIKAKFFMSKFLANIQAIFSMRGFCRVAADSFFSARQERRPNGRGGTRSLLMPFGGCQVMEHKILRPCQDPSAGYRFAHQRVHPPQTHSL